MKEPHIVRLGSSHIKMEQCRMGSDQGSSSGSRPFPSSLAAGGVNIDGGWKNTAKMHSKSTGASESVRLFFLARACPQSSFLVLSWQHGWLEWIQHRLLDSGQGLFNLAAGQQPTIFQMLLNSSLFTGLSFDFQLHGPARPVATSPFRLAFSCSSQVPGFFIPVPLLV